MPFPYNIFNGIQAPQQNTPFDRRDLLDFQGTNVIQSSRYIDPITHDFVESSNNHLQGMNAIDQAVILATNTRLNRSAQQGFGQNFLSVKTIPTNVQTAKQTFASLLAQCLAPLINNGQIVIQDVQISNNGNGQVSVSFRYNNNTSNTSVTSQFLLQ